MENDSVLQFTELQGQKWSSAWVQTPYFGLTELSPLEIEHNGAYYQPQNCRNTRLEKIVKILKIAVRILDMLGFLRKNYKIISETLKVV